MAASTNGEMHPLRSRFPLFLWMAFGSSNSWGGAVENGAVQLLFWCLSGLTRKDIEKFLVSTKVVKKTMRHGSNHVGHENNAAWKAPSLCTTDKCLGACPG